MKLHELKPAPGSRTERTRVGRGIAAGKGKTAGRGTKGQKARSGGSIPPWFEGGQTPILRRVPKLRGFKRHFKVDYEVVNVGRISEYAEGGRFAEAEEQMRRAGFGRGEAPLTVNAELLRAVGLISRIRRPVKVLGQGEVTQRLFVVADAFTKSAREKLEAAGGTAQILEVPTGRGRPGVADSAPAGEADAGATAADEPAGDTAVTVDEPAGVSAAAADEPAPEAAAAAEEQAPAGDADVAIADESPGAAVAPAPEEPAGDESDAAAEEPASDAPGDRTE